jgi:hypothetical protein
MIYFYQFLPQKMYHVKEGSPKDLHEEMAQSSNLHQIFAKMVHNLSSELSSST